MSLNESIVENAALQWFESRVCGRGLTTKQVVLACQECCQKVRYGLFPPSARLRTASTFGDRK